MPPSSPIQAGDYRIRVVLREVYEAMEVADY